MPTRLLDTLYENSEDHHWAHECNDDRSSRAPDTWIIPSMTLRPKAAAGAWNERPLMELLFAKEIARCRWGAAKSWAVFHRFLKQDPVLCSLDSSSGYPMWGHGLTNFHAFVRIQWNFITIIQRFKFFLTVFYGQKELRPMHLAEILYHNGYHQSLWIGWFALSGTKNWERHESFFCSLLHDWCF
jgi:hypothetical protein